MPSYTNAVRRTGFVFATLVLATLPWSCSSRKALDSAAVRSADSPPLAASGSAATAADLAAADRSMLDLAQGDPRARLILSEADLTIQTEQQDSLHRRLIHRTEALGGYVVESSRQRTQVRVPAGEFDGLLADLDTWGRVSRRVVKGADMTEGFRDLRLELDNAERRKNRLLEMLNQIEDIDAKLKIESELERVTFQIDVLTSRLAALRHGLKFATLTMETAKPDKDWKPGYVLEGLHLAFKGVRSLLVIR